MPAHAVVRVPVSPRYTREELDAMFTRLYPMTFRLCRRILQNEADAEDATQDVFCSIAGNIGRFRGDCRFSTWTYHVAVNACRMILRKQKSHKTDQFQEITTREGDVLDAMDLLMDPASLPRIETELSYYKIAEGLDAMIRELTPNLRNAFLAKHVLKMNQREAAEHLSISVAAFKSRLLRARLALQSKFRKAGYRSYRDLLRPPIQR